MTPTTIEPTVLNIVDQALRRIHEAEAETRAWIHLDPDATRVGDGPLTGWPLRVKDLFDVVRLPTAAGAIGGPAPDAANNGTAVLASSRSADAAIIGRKKAEFRPSSSVTSGRPRQLRRASPSQDAPGDFASTLTLLVGRHSTDLDLLEFARRREVVLAGPQEVHRAPK
jgi:hypothetical protein